MIIFRSVLSEYNDVSVTSLLSTSRTKLLAGIIHHNQLPIFLSSQERNVVA